MTLSFSTKWPARMQSCANQPNFFIQKIWMAVPDATLGTLSDYYSAHMDKFGYCWDIYQPPRPKLHTIRIGNRWKPGMKIHMVINNRTANRFQFAPIMQCHSVQHIKMWYESGEQYPTVAVDGRQYYYCNDEDDFFGIHEMENLAINDGFDSVEHFFEYFNEDFEGQIVHWTDLRY